MRKHNMSNHKSNMNGYLVETIHTREVVTPETQLIHV